MLSRINNDPLLIKTRLLQILMVLSHQAIESGADPDEVSKLDLSCAQALQSIENLNELREWTVSKVEELIRLICESRNQRQEITIKKGS